MMRTLLDALRLLLCVVGLMVGLGVAYVLGGLCAAFLELVFG